MRIKVYFEGQPGGLKDKAVRKLFEQYDGEAVGAGTNLITGIRDVEYNVPLPNANDCKAALKKAGYHLSPNW